MSDDIQNPNQQTGQQPVQTPMQQQLAQLPPVMPQQAPISAPVMADTFTPTPTAVCDDTALRYTQTVRTHLAQNLMHSGALTGNDAKQTAMLVGVLKDMDSQALGNKRIKAEEKSSGVLGDISSVMLQVLNAVNPNTFGVNPNVPAVNPASREVIHDPNATAVPGEMAVNPPQMNYKDFIAKQRGENPSSEA